MISWMRNTLSQPPIDRGLGIATTVAALFSAALVLLVVGFLVKESIPAFQEVGARRFFSDESWHPLSGQFNLAPMMVATLLISLGAIVIAGPLGILAAAFGEFYAPVRLGVFFRRSVELLAGIPSVVFGLWGLVVLAPIMLKLTGRSQSMLTATIVLSLMILPTVMLITLSTFRSLPADRVMAAAALGFNRHSMVFKLAIPSSLRGIQVGLMLAIARALGETMAVLMLAGNVVQFPESLTTPVRALTANIALEMGYATASHRSVLFVSGLALMLVSLVFVFAASITPRRHCENDR